MKQKEFLFSSRDMPNIRRKIAIELHERQLSREEAMIPMAGNFQRKISNFDGETCWFNSILQLILNAFDHERIKSPMNSMLGLMLKNHQMETLIDPRPLKNLIQHELDTSAERYQQILHKQQCSRDALIILTENRDRWMDVFCSLYHTIRHTSICQNCSNEYSMDTDQLYYEIFCPENNTSLKMMLENTFNREEPVDFNCELCLTRGKANLRNRVVPEASSEFLIIQVKRVHNNYNNEVEGTGTVNLLDPAGVPHIYTPIAIIHHRGGFGLSVRTLRHYICVMFSKMASGIIQAMQGNLN